MASGKDKGRKRPPPDPETDTSAKRSRSNNGSPAPQTNGSAAAAAAPGKIDINKAIAEARAKAQALAGKAGSQQPSAPAAPPPAAAAPGPGASTSAADRIAAIRARVAAATAKSSQSIPQRPSKPTYQPPAYDDDGMSRARGGLDVGLHPALMADSAQDQRAGKGGQGGVQSKFSGGSGNQRDSKMKGKKRLDLSGPSIEETRNNPYFDPSLGPKTAVAKGRSSRQLIFNQKGKYIAQAQALRRQHALEQMKKRIAESSRRAGIDEDLDTEKAFVVEAPPDIEWWDEGLVTGSDYSGIDAPNGVKIDAADSIITVYIQHPVALQPAQEKNKPEPKPMFLTPKEQKKIRRQRRQAELKEQQAKIRLGLEPAPPPKVKKSNLMRVLGEEAVKDPTAVEARVNREIEERHDKHVATNEARKLTKDERHDKLAKQQEGDAARGIHAAVYRVDSLANGRHRFKVSKNAEQLALTGVCLQHPKFCLVVVEGGAHAVAAYRKLMLGRINWTENVAPSAAAREANREAAKEWLQAEDADGNLRDLGSNQCQLVWEGELKSRAFRNWRSRVVDTDKEARDILSRAKMESFWTVAKTMGNAGGI